MSDNHSQRESIESAIRSVLDSATDAICLSDALFSPSGLFAQLAPTELERRRVAESPLFMEAQGRLAELRTQEADAFSRSVSQSTATEENLRMHKMERV